jgi:hypothetical protein
VLGLSRNYLLVLYQLPCRRFSLPWTYYCMYIHTCLAGLGTPSAALDVVALVHQDKNKQQQGAA